jgi:methyltransferase (TIGR00027 family)
MLRAVASSDARFPGGDDLAVAFLGRNPPSMLARVRPLRPLAAWISERVTPGSYFFEIARGRCMDDVMLAEADRGARHVVLLGAGYDSRAYRFADALPGVTFWEVDQASVADRKRERLERALGRVPDDVRYVVVDFERDDPLAALRAAGYDGSELTVWLWSGVSYYLSIDAVDRVLALVRASSPTDRSIVFDYVFRTLVEGSDDFYGAARTRRYLLRQGEPWRFGIEPDELRAFLAERGFVLEANHGPDDLARRYLSDPDGRQLGRPFGFTGICHARAS